MFAFAIWDEPRRRLWLVRDRVGKKPLYYSDAGGTLRFASELKALVADPQVPRDVDHDAMRLYLRYGYVPSPYTIYSGIHKLPPAHHLICEAGRITVQRSWDPVQHALQTQPSTPAATAKCWPSSIGCRRCTTSRSPTPPRCRRISSREPRARWSRWRSPATAATNSSSATRAIAITRPRPLCSRCRVRSATPW